MPQIHLVGFAPSDHRLLRCQVAADIARVAHNDVDGVNRNAQVGPRRWWWCVCKVAPKVL